MQTPTNSQQWTQWLIWNRYEECGCAILNHIYDDENMLGLVLDMSQGFRVFSTIHNLRLIPTIH